MSRNPGPLPALFLIIVSFAAATCGNGKSSSSNSPQIGPSRACYGLTAEEENSIRTQALAALSADTHVTAYAQFVSTYSIAISRAAEHAGRWAWQITNSTWKKTESTADCDWPVCGSYHFTNGSILRRASIVGYFEPMINFSNWLNLFLTLPGHAQYTERSGQWELPANKLQYGVANGISSWNFSNVSADPDFKAFVRTESGPIGYRRATSKCITCVPGNWALSLSTQPYSLFATVTATAGTYSSTITAFVSLNGVERYKETATANPLSCDLSPLFDLYPPLEKRLAWPGPLTP